MTSSCAAAIRAATLEDAAEIGRVHVAAWHETYGKLLPPAILDGQSADKRARLWERVLRAPARHAATAVFVAETEAGIVGFGSCGRQRTATLKSRGHDGEITSLYILRPFQRCRIGTELMRTLAGALRSDGIRSMSLWVLRENDDARHFYKRLGGTLAGVREETLGRTVLSEVAYHWPSLAAIADGRAIADIDKQADASQTAGLEHVIC